jgi:hypothetical protein
MPLFECMVGEIIISSDQQQNKWAFKSKWNPLVFPFNSGLLKSKYQENRMKEVSLHVEQGISHKKAGLSLQVNLPIQSK